MWIDPLEVVIRLARLGQTNQIKANGIAVNEVTKHLLILLTVGVAVFFTNLGAAKLWDRDEPRNAGCAKEMMERGDWVVPVFNDELRAQKPVLLYWLMMTAYAVFGVNEFSARFWSAILAIGSVLATYFIGKRLIDSKVGLLGSIILATTVMFDVAGRAATPDSVLIFCSTMAIMIYVLSVFKTSGDENLPTEPLTWFPKSFSAISGFYFFLGLGTLAKGPIGFLLPMAIIGMFMLVMRANPVEPQSSKFRTTILNLWQTLNPVHFLKTVWAMRPLLAAMIVLAIAAPWYCWVGLRTEGDFLQKFFLTENFARATTAMENHSGGPWYYPATILLGFFPWSVFAFPVSLFVWRQLRSHEASKIRPALCFLLCWVGVQVGLFSLASTKLPSYVTPCYPALALLAAMGLQSFAKSQQVVADRWFRLAAIVLACTGVATIVGMIFVAQQYLDGDAAVCLVGLAPLAGGVAGYLLMRKNKNQRAIEVISFSAVLLCVSMFGFGTVAVDQHRDMADVMTPMIDSESEVATFGVLESSWVFYANRRLFELAHDNNPNHPTSIERAKNWKPKPWVTPESFARNEGGLILTTDQKVESLLSRLPNYRIIERSPYFLNDNELILVGPQSPQHHAKASSNGAEVR